MMDTWRARLEDYIAADKLRWVLENPDHAWIGPHVAERALNECDTLNARIEKLETALKKIQDLTERAKIECAIDLATEALAGEGGE
jgi:hypothetical protein